MRYIKKQKILFPLISLIKSNFKAYHVALKATTKIVEIFSSINIEYISNFKYLFQIIKNKFFQNLKILILLNFE